MARNLFGCFLLLACYLPISICDDGETVVAGNNQFTTALFNELAKTNDGNIFFSPSSVHTILGLTAQGAEGETETAFQNALHIPADKIASADGFHSAISNLNDVANITLNTANKVYVKEGYKMNPKFEETATKKFYAEAQNLDFSQNKEAANTINTWVSEKTNDKIKNLISPDALDESTMMVLVNAIYFKANWEKKFLPSATRSEAFYKSKDNSVNVQMMHNTGQYNYEDNKDLDAKVIQLPYANPNVNMVVVLPNDVDGINDLQEKLKNYDLPSLTRNTRKVEVELSFPKFKLETTMDLNDPLKKIGLSNIFSDNANFSGLIEGSAQLKVSKVVQKAFIEVDETGSEAAAATGVLIAAFASISPKQKVIFSADHPFIFMINARHEDGEVVLFMGKFAKN